MSRTYWPVIATVALHGALLALYVAKHGGDVCSFAVVGKVRAGTPPYEAVTASVGPNGYDGQFYYVIARAPWRLQGHGIDDPAARQLRILYPALCWLLSGGHARLLFWIMPAVNLAALAALAVLGVRLATHYGINTWWAFLLPLALNAGMPAMHNLTDNFSTLALFGLLSAWLLASRWWVLALWAAIAVFSREQNVAIAAIVITGAFWRKRRMIAVGIGAVVLLWLAWVCCLHGAYGRWPFLAGQGNLDLPFSGMLFRWAHPGGNDAFSRRLAIILCSSMVHLTLQMMLALYLAGRAMDRVVSLCMLAGVALAVVGGTYIYKDFWSYTRVFAWIPIGIWLGSSQLRLTWPLVGLAPASLWTLVAALRYV